MENKPNLYVMIGIPGSGKSYKAAEISKQEKAIVHSSDAIRAELYGDASIQSDPKKVFGILNYRVRRTLESGRNCILDAMNLNAHGRRQLVKKYSHLANIIAVEINTPLDVCLSRNASRDRVVPPEIIREKFEKKSLVTEDEGFTEIRRC